MSRFRILAAGAVLASSVVVGSLTVTTPATAATTTPVPSRVLDTRSGLGAAIGPVGPGQVIRLAAPAAALSAGATSLVVNLTATEASAAGYVTMWSCDEAKPATSNLNFVPGQSVPNMGIVRPSSNGTICLEASVRVHLVADLMAWFTGSNDVSPTRPNRIVDTRLTGDPLPQGEFRRIRVGGTAGVPAGAQAALVNITVTNPRSEGFVSVVPCPAGGVGPSPRSSTVNFQSGDTVAAFTVTALVNNDVCLYSHSATDVVVDTFGWSSSANGLRLKAPERVLDTRAGIWASGPARSDEVIRLRVAGRGGIPNESAAVLLTLTVADAWDSGYVTAWSCDTARPTASVLNYWPGAIRANSVLVGLSAGSGEVCLFAKSSNGRPVSLIADAVGWVPGTISRAPVPPPPAPPAGRFVTLPVGSVLPSGAECATRVRPAAEIRPENAASNATRGSRANANTDPSWSAFSRVDGDFAGTTDEIIQWAACKWGIDEDIARAQVIKESYWYQNGPPGDNGESWGLGQVRVPYHQSAFQYPVNARTSSAYNLDYTYAIWRGCYEGVFTWFNTVERNGTYAAGDVWGCIGAWFSGRWYVNTSAYLDEFGNSVRWHYNNKTWLTSSFING